MTMTIIDTERGGAAEPAVRAPIAPAVPSAGALRPLGSGEVRITGGYWAERQEVNAQATLAHIEHWLEREGWLGNFDRAAAGTLPDGRRGREFSDSEVYKFLEAMAWEIGRTDDAQLEERFRRVLARWSPRRSPTATSTRTSAGPARRPAGPTSSGAMSCTAPAT